MNHRFEHLRRCDHRAPSSDASANDLFLQVREFLDGKLGAEVAAGDHYCVGDFHDGCQVLNRSTSFNLCNDHWTAWCRFGPDPANIMSGTNEGKSDHVDTNIDKCVKETEILWRRRRYTKPVRRNVNAWSPGKVSAVVDANTEMVSLSSKRQDLHGSISEHQLVTFVNVSQQVFIINLKYLGRA
jgi:hypothetical protein